MYAKQLKGPFFRSPENLEKCRLGSFARIRQCVVGSFALTFVRQRFCALLHR